MKHKAANPADVALVLEGTYPYVLGGVSAWINQIIRGLPELKFALVYIGGRAGANPSMVYELPPNVDSLTEIYLHEKWPDAELKPAWKGAQSRAAVYAALRRFFELPSLDSSSFWDLVAAFEAAGPHLTLGNLTFDLESWELMKSLYDQEAPNESWIDFFWTVRAVIAPLWSVWRNRERLPEARLYHSISTGYAGLLGALAARSFDVPYLLTEHGIYVKERLAEIIQAEWIHERPPAPLGFTETGRLKQIWVALFRLLALVAYDAADQIVTLFQGNAETQIEFGAPPGKITIIPNGIDTGTFSSWKRPRPDATQKKIGFVGRVVPIKDIKTLLKAARHVCCRLPQVEFIIAGPTTEDAAYFRDCEQIVQAHGMQNAVRFRGPMRISEVLPQIDALVLTSISEGLPLVLLEAMAAGVPVVATDVGACRELIFGRSPEDKALGRSGFLTKIMAPEETAGALIRLLSVPGMAQAMGEAGRQRVRNHYELDRMIESYRTLYENPPANRNRADGCPALLPQA